MHMASNCLYPFLPSIWHIYWYTSPIDAFQVISTYGLCVAYEDIVVAGIYMDIL